MGISHPVSGRKVRQGLAHVGRTVEAHRSALDRQAEAIVSLHRRLEEVEGQLALGFFARLRRLFTRGGGAAQ